MELKKYRQRLIEKYVMVGINQQTPIRLDNSDKIVDNKINDDRYITNLKIIRKQDQQEMINQSIMVKFLQLNSFYSLQVFYNQQHKFPVNNIKILSEVPLNWNKVTYINQYNQEQSEYICFNNSEQHSIAIRNIDVVQKQQYQLYKSINQYNFKILPLTIQTAKSKQQLSFKKITLFLKIQFNSYKEKIYYEPSITYLKDCCNDLKIDWKSFPFFCFPQGVQIQNQLQNCGGYQSFNFILTLENGIRIYVNCIKIYEQATSKLGYYILNKDNKYKHFDKKIYVEKMFCIISKFRLTDLFSQWFQHLYRQYLTNNIKNELNQSSNNFQFNIDIFINKIQQIRLNKNLQYQDRYSQKIVYPQKIINSFFSLKPIYCLFKMLTIGNIVRIFQAILLQQNVYFISQSQTILGYILQSFLSLLSPLQWQHIILPCLPINLFDYLDAPIPLLACLNSNLITNYKSLFSHQGLFVFLDENKLNYISINNNNNKSIHSNSSCNSNTNNYSFEIYHPALNNLLLSLSIYDVFNQQHIKQFKQFHQILYTFNIHQTQQQQQQQFNIYHIYQLFYVSILNIMKYYDHYYKIKILSDSNNIDLKRLSFKKVYDEKMFVKGKCKASNKWMKQFVQCNIFINFIQKRILEPNSKLILQFNQDLQELQKDFLSPLTCNLLNNKKQLKSEEKNNNKLANTIIKRFNQDYLQPKIILQANKSKDESTSDTQRNKNNEQRKTNFNQTNSTGKGVCIIFQKAAYKLTNSSIFNQLKLFFKKQHNKSNHNQDQQIKRCTQQKLQK